MSTAAASSGPDLSRGKRLDVLFEELAELTGQRNALDGRIVDIVAEIDGDGVYGLWGSTGCRSITALVAWKTGVSPRNAETVVAIAKRAQEFPLCTDGLREGRFSLDQVGAIAEDAADGSDAHYAQFAESATVTQLRTAISLETKPDKPAPEPKRSISRSEHGDHTTWKITLPKLEAARFGAALDSQREVLIADWKRDHAEAVTGQTPPMPTTVDAFLSLIDAGWDADVAARPHGQRTTVVAHLDVDKHVASLHLGPLLSDDERRYLLCDATCEVWFERHGRPIGTGRTTRTVNRRLRRALEHRDHGTCVVPGCGATRGLHAHHVGRTLGPTEPSSPGLPVSPPGPPQGRHHHQRRRRPPRGQRPLRPRTDQRVPGATTDSPPTRGRPLQGSDRRTRPMVVVRPLQTTPTTDNQPSRRRCYPLVASGESTST